jgi:hypothetical protein
MRQHNPEFVPPHRLENPFATIASSNGVIHDIDAVIMPKNWQLLAAAA